ncbi:MAG: tetratricopeptide repeat protein [Desulfovibrio sp.]|nr:tetratricopeptide repeat protein [Desulfovibrio sp.]
MTKTTEPGVSRRGLFRLIAGRAPEPGPTSEEIGAWVVAAREAFARGDFQTSVEHFRTWLRHTPGDDDSRMLLGRALYAVGRHVQALVEFDRVARRHAEHPAALFLCLCRLRLGKTDKAPEAFHAVGALVTKFPRELVERIEAVRDDTSLASEAADALETALLQIIPPLPATADAREASGRETHPT